MNHPITYLKPIMLSYPVIIIIGILGILNLLKFNILIGIVASVVAYRLFIDRRKENTKQVNSNLVRV